MSKFKKYLHALTLGLAFTSPSYSQEEHIPPTLKEYSQQQALEESLRPQARPSVTSNGSFEEYLSYLKWIDTTRTISKPPTIEQIQELRTTFGQIQKISENQLTQDQKDFRMYYNRHKYELEKPFVLNQISKILKTESPNINIIGNLNILQGRIRNQAYNTNRTPNSFEPVIFYPNEVDPELNQFILQNINDPQKISNGAITKIHPSYYKFLVALLLQENNFGNTTTSSAKAEGKFQIKPDTQQFVKDNFNLTLTQQKDKEVLGFLHLFQLAKLFNIDVSKEPTDEEIILLSFTYFQGQDAYTNLLELDNFTLQKIREYSYNILLVMQREDLFEIHQDRSSSES
ncbi:MAG: hypothetical protein ACLFPL_05645 [Candidatus Nanoarchaeia archaeon]